MIRLTHPATGAVTDVAHSKTADVLRRSGWVDIDRAVSNDLDTVEVDDDPDGSVEEQPTEEG